MIHTIAIAAALIASAATPHIRTETGTVTNTTHTNTGLQSAVVTTADGNIWRLTNVDMTHDQCIRLVLDNNGTDDVTDDVIIAWD